MNSKLCLIFVALTLTSTVEVLAVPQTSETRCIENIRKNYTPENLAAAIEKMRLHKFENDDDADKTKNFLLANSKFVEKVDAVYKASGRYEIPPEILFAVVEIESSLIDDGIDVDGGNYSCGISQLDLAEWCNWAQAQPDHKTQVMGWPVKEITAFKTKKNIDNICDEDVVDNSGIELMMNKLKAKYPDRSLHEIKPKLATSMLEDEFRLGFPSLDLDEVHLKYLLTTSFLRNCTLHRHAIPALANELRRIFDENVPSDLKESDKVPGGKIFGGSCARPSNSHYFPMSPSWMMTALIYNGGDTILTGVDKNKSVPWNQLTVADITQAVSKILAGTEYYQKVRYDWEVIQRYLNAILFFELKPAPVVSKTQEPQK